MPEYIIEGCTVADGDDVARNNMTAFWSDPNWRLVWKKVTLPYVIEQCAARTPRNLLNERETLRHSKAVDPKTGKFLGYIRWKLPYKYCKKEDGSPVCPEGQVPDVSPEEKARIVERAEIADWNPDTETDHLDVPVTKMKKEFLAKKDYIGGPLTAIELLIIISSDLTWLNSDRVLRSPSRKPGERSRDCAAWACSS